MRTHLANNPQVTGMGEPGNVWLVVPVLLPFLGVMLGLLAGRHVRSVVLLTVLAGLGVVLAIGSDYLAGAQAQTYLLGGWPPPLGIALRADGLAVAMMVAVAVVVAGISAYAWHDFALPVESTDARMPSMYWLLLLAVWGSLNLVFLSGDLFTLYVALELLTFAGVPLVCLDGRGETLRAALRYLLFALAGSLLYLLGAVLLYGTYGTLDIAQLAGLARPETVTWTAGALMTVGLLAKTALFPLHLWLPPAHAGAPAAGSAILSALVIKGSWFLVVRLWFDALPGVVSLPAAQLLAALGASAIVIGSVVALRQERLKLLVAYSTVAQIGYLFLMFPLAFGSDAALDAGVLQAIAHATAKAGMFMAAGLVYAALGHDRIADLSGVARAMPMTVLAFALAGVALMGVLPSGAYLSKKILLAAAGDSGQWWWTMVLQGGAAFTAAYMVLVLGQALRAPAAPVVLARRVPKLAEMAALVLALCSFLLALAALGPVPRELLSSALKPSEWLTMLVIVSAGALLAFGLARHPPWVAEDGRLRRISTLAGVAFGKLDAWSRQWSVATLALLLLALMFGALFRTAVPA